MELPEGVELGHREVRLTYREWQVLSYLALGWETRYIAEELGLSWDAVRNHICHRSRFPNVDAGIPLPERLHLVDPHRRIAEIFVTSGPATRRCPDR